jgi:hypothetical protein
LSHDAQAPPIRADVNPKDIRVCYSQYSDLHKTEPDKDQPCFPQRNVFPRLAQDFRNTCKASKYLYKNIAHSSVAGVQSAGMHVCNNRIEELLSISGSTRLRVDERIIIRLPKHGAAKTLTIQPLNLCFEIR